MKQVSVIGGGSWGTAIVKMLCNNVDKVHWYMRNQSAVDHLNKYNHNPKYLQSVEFQPDKIAVSTNLSEVVDASDMVIVVTPAAFLHEMFSVIDKAQLKNKLIVSAVKGIVPEFHSIPARYFHKEFDVPYSSIGMICGPCHAEEVALEKLSYLTIACQDEDKAVSIAEQLECRYIKTSTSDDLFGTEWSAVLKNVYAIAAGMYHGLGYGDNFQAVLMSNAIIEIQRFVDAVNPTHRDVKTSGYLGDLLVTGYSQFSRNRVFGTMIGKGYSTKAAQLEMNMIAEGYYAVKSVYEINKKYNVDMAIADSVYRCIYEKISPVIEMRILADSFT